MTNKQLATFIQVFADLSLFEAQHRQLRNWGLYSQEDLDKLCPDIKAVMDELKYAVEHPEIDVHFIKVEK
jgi:hypothetical protein